MTPAKRHSEFCLTRLGHLVALLESAVLSHGEGDRPRGSLESGGKGWERSEAAGGRRAGEPPLQLVLMSPETPKAGRPGKKLRSHPGASEGLQGTTTQTASHREGPGPSNTQALALL